MRTVPFGLADKRALTMGLAVVSLVCAGLVVRYVAQFDGALVHDFRPIGRDFVAFWTASHLVLEGRVDAIADLGRFTAAQVEALGQAFELRVWIYPPHFLFFVAPLALLPYLWSYAAWVVATLAMNLVAAVGGRWPRIEAAALVFAPATYANATAGQNGFLSAALLVGGVRLLERRPVAAGVLLGLLSFKPHLGILVPVMLVAARKWTSFASASATVVVLVLASVALWGWEPWVALVGQHAPQQLARMMRGEDAFVFMIASPFMAMRLLGFGAAAGYAAQAVFTIGAGAGVYWAFRRTDDRNLRMAAILTGAIMATPYALSYDLTLLSVALVYLMRHAVVTGFLPGERVLICAVWLLPLYLAVMNWYGWPLAPVLIASLFGCLMVRAKGGVAVSRGMHGMTVQD